MIFLYRVKGDWQEVCFWIDTAYTPLRYQKGITGLIVYLILILRLEEGDIMLHTKMRCLNIIAAVAMSLHAVIAVSQTVEIEPYSDEVYADALEQEAFSLGVMAYIYGRGPMLSYEWRYTELWDKSFTPAKGRMNEIFHFREAWNPDFGGAAANNEVVYSEAWIDLGGASYVLHIPPNDGRYYSVQVFDFYTNTVGYMGRHTHGAAGLNLLLTGPDWDGVRPEGVDDVVQSPTSTGYIVIRTFVNNVADLKNVAAYQEQYRLTPSTQWKDGKPTMKPALVDAYEAPPIFDLSEPLNYFIFLNHALTENTPPPEDAGLMAMLERIQVGPNQNFDIANLNPSVEAGLRRAVPAAIRIIDMAIQTGLTSSTLANGWEYTPDVGRHGLNYLRRAAIAKNFPHPLPKEGAFYPIVRVDSDGQQFNGSNRYQLTLTPDMIPQVEAFWSLSIYDEQTRFVKNEINRYTISDRTKGIKFEGDGTLKIIIQHDRPTEGGSNWLPAPPGSFFMALRAYQPSKEIQAGEYIPPPVERLNNK